MILGMQKSILATAPHDLSNTKTIILGVIPHFDGNPHERFSFAPAFKNWGGPHTPDLGTFAAFRDFCDTTGQKGGGHGCLIRGMGDRFLSSAGAGGICVRPMRLPDPSPVLDKNRAPMGPEILSSTGAGVWRKAPMAFPDSSSVLDKFQSAKGVYRGYGMAGYSWLRDCRPQIAEFESRLKFSISLENFKPDLQNSPQKKRGLVGGALEIFNLA